MKKVKLTQEQVQTVRNFMNNDNVLKLSLNELHRVIDGEYEVEKSFNVGDWVVKGYGGIIGEVIGKVEGITESTYGIEELHGLWSNFLKHKTIIANEGDIRHATPEEIAKEKQRRWWAKHGRDVYEFKSGDLIDHDHYVVEVMEVRSDMLRVEINTTVATITEEYYDLIKVICFAEDRKDMEA